MKYALLIYGDPTAAPAEDSPEGQAEFEGWISYTQQMADAGIMGASEALHPATAASTVRARGGETLTTDGPFAETKEILFGFYVIDVHDLDTALGWAARAPNIAYGSIEVRPVMEFDQG